MGSACRQWMQFHFFLPHGTRIAWLQLSRLTFGTWSKNGWLCTVFMKCVKRKVEPQLACILCFQSHLTSWIKPWQVSGAHHLNIEYPFWLGFHVDFSLANWRWTTLCLWYPICQHSIHFLARKVVFSQLEWLQAISRCHMNVNRLFRFIIFIFDMIFCFFVSNKYAQSPYIISAIYVHRQNLPERHWRKHTLMCLLLFISNAMKHHHFYENLISPKKNSLCHCSWIIQYHIQM